MEIFSSLPELSDNARSIAVAAVNEAQRRQHTALFSEHILWALFHSPCHPRSQQWLARISGLAEDELCVRIDTSLERLPSWSPRGSGGAAFGGDRRLLPTPALARVVAVLQQICGGTVTDGLLVFAHGLVASEFLLAAIVVEGTSTAAKIVVQCSDGFANAVNICTAIGVDVHAIHPARRDGLGPSIFKAVTINTGSSRGATKKAGRRTGRTPGSAGL